MDKDINNQSIEKNVGYIDEDNFEYREEKTAVLSPRAKLLILVAVVFVILGTVIGLLAGKKNGEKKGSEEVSSEYSQTETTEPEESTTGIADKYQKGVYTVQNNDGDGINLRAEPDSDSENLGRVYNGTVVDVLEVKYVENAPEDQQFWGKIKDGDKTGWIALYYASEVYPKTNDETTSESGSVPSFGNYLVDTSSIDNISLNIRESYSVYSDIIGAIPNGAVIKIVEVTVDDSADSEALKYWGKVSYSEGSGSKVITGWISMYYLKTAD